MRNDEMVNSSEGKRVGVDSGRQKGGGEEMGVMGI